MDDLDMDTRLLRRSLAKGFVSQAAVDARLAALPDVADRADWVSLADLAASDDEGDGDGDDD